MRKRWAQTDGGDVNETGSNSMSFVPNTTAIKSVIERRLLVVDLAVRNSFPAVLQQDSVQWISFGDEDLLGIIFIQKEDMDRVRLFQHKHWNPFPGLLTTDPTQSAAFHFEKSRFVAMDSCRVAGVSFSIGPDCTIFVVNHAQDIATTEAGQVAYTLPLGYFVSFGTEVTADNVYEHLDALIAYSVKTWLERDQPT